MLRATDQGLAAIGATTAPAHQPPTIEGFSHAVIGLLANEGCNATILEEDEARTMVADSHTNGRPAVRVAGDILAWLVETEAEAEGAAEAANGGARGRRRS